MAIGLLGFIFAMAALAKVRRLEQRLKDAGVLKVSPSVDGQE